MVTQGNPRRLRARAQNDKHSSFFGFVIGIIFGEFLEEQFPGYLHVVRSKGTLLPDFNRKAAFEAILDDCLSPRDKQDEFMKFTEAIATATYIHQPRSSSLFLYLTELERLRKTQKIVEPTPSAGITYELLMIKAHTHRSARALEEGTN